MVKLYNGGGCWEVYLTTSNRKLELTSEEMEEISHGSEYVKDLIEEVESLVVENKELNESQEKIEHIIGDIECKLEEVKNLL